MGNCLSYRVVLTVKKVLTGLYSQSKKSQHSQNVEEYWYVDINCYRYQILFVPDLQALEHKTWETLQGLGNCLGYINFCET